MMQTVLTPYEVFTLSMTVGALVTAIVGTPIFMVCVRVAEWRQRRADNGVVMVRKMVG